MNRLLILSCLVALLAGCGAYDARSARGFRLPDGNADAGRAAFVQLRCHTCHTVAGIDAKFEGTGAATVPLGGNTLRVRTYGDLVTSIINPSHRIPRGDAANQLAPGGVSLMEIGQLNDTLTVRQLIDLVAFLQTTYQVQPPDINPYLYVYP